MPVAGEGVENAADELHLAFADAAGLPGVGFAQRAVAIDHGALHLLERHAREADRRPAGLVENVDDEIEVRLAGNGAAGGDAIEEALGFLGRHVALGLDLEHEMVGQRVDVELGPGWVLALAGLVEGEESLGLVGRNEGVVVEGAFQPQHVDVVDAAPLQHLGNRKRLQRAHLSPAGKSTWPGE